MLSTNAMADPLPLHTSSASENRRSTVLQGCKVECCFFHFFTSGSPFIPLRGCCGFDLKKIRRNLAQARTSRSQGRARSRPYHRISSTCVCVCVCVPESTVLKLLLSSSHYDNSHSTTVSLFLAAISCALDQLPVVTYTGFTQQHCVPSRVPSQVLLLLA